MPKTIANLNLNKNELQNGVIHPLASAPSSPKEGQVYYNTTEDNIYRYTGTQWVAYTPALIPFGTVASTSTATVFTATVPGVTELKDGVCVLLRNSVITSASGFTINVNGLGAKPCYSNMATGNPTTPTDPTRETTIFNINYTMLFIYSESLVSGGCWICYRGYDANTNTIGYQVRTNSISLPMKQITYRYRLLFMSADNLGWVPANTSTSTNATAKRDVNQAKINPFGPIVYYGTTASVAAGSRPSATVLWQQYALTLGYSFNRTGAALTLTSWKPIYVKCAPQADGSAIMDADDPFVQTLPSTADGKIYIYLGIAYSATNIELTYNHPVYEFKDGAIREWTNTFIPTKTSQLTNDSGFITSAPTIASTTSLLKGDGNGNAVAAVSGTDYSLPPYYAEFSIVPGIDEETVSCDTSISSLIQMFDERPVYGISDGVVFQLMLVDSNSVIFQVQSDTAIITIAGVIEQSTDVWEINYLYLQPALPDQDGNSGKFLTTNGSTMSWETVPTGSTVTFSQGLSSGTQVGTITIDGTSTNLYAPSDTDEKVNQAKVTYSSYTNWRAIPFGVYNNASPTAALALSTGYSSTDREYSVDNLRFWPQKGWLRTHVFNPAPNEAGTTNSYNQMTSDSVNNIYFRVNATGTTTGTAGDTVLTLYSDGTDMQVRPGGQYDDKVDLGKSTVRWKDLYLSGEIYADNSTKLLPTVTSSDNGKILAVVNGGWQATNNLNRILRVRFVQENTVWTADETFANILAVYNAGGLVYFEFPGRELPSCIAYAVTSNDTITAFEGLRINVTDTNVIKKRFTLDSSDVVTVTTEGSYTYPTIYNGETYTIGEGVGF